MSNKVYIMPIRYTTKYVGYFKTNKIVFETQVDAVLWGIRILKLLLRESIIYEREIDLELKYMLCRLRLHCKTSDYLKIAN